MPKIKRIKPMLFGGGICGAVGAFLGFAEGLAFEGASGGSAFGLVVGEIIGIGASDHNG